MKITQHQSSREDLKATKEKKTDHPQRNGKQTDGKHDESLNRWNSNLKMLRGNKPQSRPW